MVRNLDAGMMPAYPDESLVVAVQVLIKIHFYNQIRNPMGTFKEGFNSRNRP